MNTYDNAVQEQDLGGEKDRGFARIGEVAAADLLAQVLTSVRVSLGDVQPRDTNTSTMPQMFDATIAERLVIEVVSTLDQPSDIQVVGSTDNVPEETNRHYPIGNTLTLPANGRGAATINLVAAWFPFIGITVTPTTTPTTGGVTARATAQRALEKAP